MSDVHELRQRSFSGVTSAPEMINRWPPSHYARLDASAVGWEDVADNLFHPDPYFQSGGDMVRVGGMGYAIDIGKPAGSRISEMTHLTSGKPIEAGKTYSVAGWASINENTEGPPIWDVVAAHVGKTGAVKVEPNTAVKVSGA